MVARLRKDEERGGGGVQHVSIRDVQGEGRVEPLLRKRNFPSASGGRLLPQVCNLYTSIWQPRGQHFGFLGLRFDPKWRQRNGQKVFHTDVPVTQQGIGTWE